MLVLANLDFGAVYKITGLDPTETSQGVAEIATQTETNAGTDDLRYVTPLKLAGRLAVAMPTPGRTVASSTVALSGVETVVLPSTAITLAAGTTGRIEILAAVQVGLGSVLLGSNGAELRVYVDGVLDPDATAQIQQTATLAVTLSFDASQLSLLSERTGQSAAAHAVEVRAVKLGAVSTANVNGRRTLSVKQI